MGSCVLTGQTALSSSDLVVRVRTFQLISYYGVLPLPLPRLYGYVLMKRWSLPFAFLFWSQTVLELDGNLGTLGGKVKVNCYVMPTMEAI